jgi:hypothetical protein
LSSIAAFSFCLTSSSYSSWRTFILYIRLAISTEQDNTKLVS